MCSRCGGRGKRLAAGRRAERPGRGKIKKRGWERRAAGHGQNENKREGGNGRARCAHLALEHQRRRGDEIGEEPFAKRVVRFVRRNRVGPHLVLLALLVLLVVRVVVAARRRGGDDAGRARRGDRVRGGGGRGRGGGGGDVRRGRGGVRGRDADAHEVARVRVGVEEAELKQLHQERLGTCETIDRTSQGRRRSQVGRWLVDGW
jgi:hypothetical protein